MKWRQVEQRLRNCGFTIGTQSKHRTIWNCPCPHHEHAVGVENHPSNEAYIFDYKRKLGPHRECFGI